MNCKDKELNAKLHSNRAAAHLYLGKMMQLVVLNVLLFLLEIILVAKLSFAKGLSSEQKRPQLYFRRGWSAARY